MSTESPAEPWSKRNPFPSPLLVNRKLNKPGTHRDCRHLEFSLEGSGFSYEVGDVLATYPKNDPEHVQEILALLPFDGSSEIELKGTGTIPLEQALLENLDICTVNKGIIKKWNQFSSHPDLIAAMDDSEKMDQVLQNRHLYDLMNEYPAEFNSAADFAGVLRKLLPRLYSIASSPNAHPGEVHLTVAKVEYEMNDKPRKGVCSTFLCDRLPDGESVRVFLQHAKHFKLPTDLSRDVIMVGPGTGIAPFRAFLEERKVSRASGRNWLFFGNPHEETDYFYQEEFEAMQAEDILQRIDLAWSRDQAEKVYVQHKIEAAAEELWSWIDGGAHFYVCGDAKYMAGDVDKALHNLISQYGNRSEEEAAEYVEQMKKDHRYQRDVY